MVLEEKFVKNTIFGKIKIESNINEIKDKKLKNKTKIGKKINKLAKLKKDKNWQKKKTFDKKIVKKKFFKKRQKLAKF